MLQRSAPANAYFRTQVQSSTPLERVVMLYDAAIRALDTAREAMGRHDLLARRDAMSRLLAIVTELQNTLDLERGGQIAADLDRLYDYVITRVVESLTTQTPQGLEEARKVLVPLRDAWQAIAASPSMAGATTP
jgi:flagellar protein FliS